MIQYIYHKDLNFDKYNACVKNAYNSRIYAYSWYLDIVADDWDALVLNDYKAVMPLPKRKKYGIHYIYQPPWVQQLGVFGVQRISEDEINEFFQYIPDRFKKVDIMINSGNKFKSPLISLRTNYLINLENSYSKIYKHYSNSKKGKIRKAEKRELILKESTDYQSVINLFKENTGKKIKRDENDYSILEKLIDKSIMLDKVRVLHVLNQKNIFLAGAFFFHDNKRITYLFSALGKEGRENQAMSFLLDFVINTYSNSNLIFDFEGSIIPEIATFFKSFGAIQETYYHYKKIKYF